MASAIDVSKLKELIRATLPEGTNPKKQSAAKVTGPLAPLFINRDFTQCCPVNYCDEVYPGIILGDNRYARDVDKLQSLGVTHLLNAAQGTKFAQIDSHASNFSHVNIQFMGIQAKDIAKYNLSQHFRPAAEFIHTALSSGGKVFVHCFQGISRSATLVLVYLMMYQHLALEDAIVTIRKKRAIYPNDGFLKQLMELDAQLGRDRETKREAGKNDGTAKAEESEVKDIDTREQIEQEIEQLKINK